jgi:GAF domain-containing protein
MTLRVGMKRRATTGGKVGKARRSKPAATLTSRQRRRSDNDSDKIIEQLKRERDEALEQQTATAEVLRVISSSPGELGPVFQAMLENAVRICEARFGVLNLHEVGAVRAGAMHNVPPAFAEFLRDRGAHSPVVGSLLEHVMRTKQVAHTVDNAAQFVGRAATLGGARSTVCVPMLADEELVGTITIYRQEVRPFTNKQIELVQNFAAQAVIAIENTRLLNELRESLENQTSSADILHTIASSPARAERALDVIAETTGRRFGASNVNIRLLYGNVLRCVGSTGPMAARMQALFPEGPLDTNAASGRAILEQRQIYLRAGTARSDGLRIPSSATGILSSVATPLIREGQAIGVLMVLRSDPRPFSETDLAQLSNFAAQAVIAIEPIDGLPAALLSQANRFNSGIGISGEFAPDTIRIRGSGDERSAVR